MPLRSFSPIVAAAGLSLLACASTPMTHPDAAPAVSPIPAPVVAPQPPDPNAEHQAILSGAWTPQQQHEVLSKTTTITLSPDLSALTLGERACLGKLIEVGHIMHDLYERSLHHQASAARAAVTGGAASEGLRQLYALFGGPIATTLDNQRVPFLQVDAEQPGKNVYPVGIDKAAIDSFMQQSPERRASLLHLRSVVRSADAATVAADLAALDRHPVLDVLHPGLRERIATAANQPGSFYGLPYSVAYADEIVRAHELLSEAADLVDGDDPAFARYLRNRARDLLTDDYEAGDAAWVTGKFRHLNAQIGAYEVYPDQLYGTKAFFSTSLLVRDEAASTELAGAIGDLQAFEDSLPYAHHKRVRSDIAVGVYNVVADFGQARGRNTATILPNEAYLARQYGRTILLRANIMRNPEVFAGGHSTWAAAVEPKFADDLTVDGNFYRALWHEIGHYLGVDTTHDGRSLDDALGANSSTFEEMKADLVSLYVAKALRKSGYHDDARLRSIYASGIGRTLQSVKPRPTQPYQTMQLMQFNYFLANGLLSFDGATGKLSIDYRKYHRVVKALLGEVLELQRQGDAAKTAAFIAQYTTWRDDLHGVIAANMQANQPFRYSTMRYEVLGQ